MGNIMPLMTVVGPIILLAAIIWAYLRTRNGRRREIDQAEVGAKEVREDIRKDPEYREGRH